MAPTIDTLQVRFRPVLDLTKNEAWIYRAVPVMVHGDEENVGEDSVIPYDDDSIETARINAKVITAAGQSLTAAADHDVLLMIPINANALGTTQGATIIVDALNTVPDEVAKSLIAHVFGLPDKVTLDFLDDAVIPIMFTTSKFIVEPPMALEDYTDIAACNAQGVVLDMAVRKEDFSDLTNVWSRATPRRLSIFVQNVADAAVLPMAERYKCRGVDGPLFGELLPDIGPRIPGAELLAKARSAG